MEKKSAFITDYNLITPLGFDVKSNWNAILEGKSGIKKHQIIPHQPKFLASIIDDEELEMEFNNNFENQDFTRLEKMLLLSLKPVVENNKVTDKSILILSTTKGNISNLKNQESVPLETYLSVLAQKIADFFSFKIKPIVVSNACVSGVMAIAVAKKLIGCNFCKNAFIVAGDEVSEFVISGFNSFQALSGNPCKPYDKNRDGISIGEAAASCFITSKKPNEKVSFKVLGESSINDANHISGPSRTGEGLFQSIQNAIYEAEIQPEKIDFISAHGTATLYNDEMESIAFSRAQLSEIPLNSLKGFYGHCLGASGLLESILSMESAKRNILIASKNYENLGVSENLNIIQENQSAEINLILKTASGFGGCNSAIILQKN